MVKDLFLYRYKYILKFSYYNQQSAKKQPVYRFFRIENLQNTVNKFVTFLKIQQQKSGECPTGKTINEKAPVFY
jgi:hypothetical protein